MYVFESIKIEWLYFGGLSKKIKLTLWEVIHSPQSFHGQFLPIIFPKFLQIRTRRWPINAYLSGHHSSTEDLIRGIASTNDCHWWPPFISLLSAWPQGGVWVSFIVHILFQWGWGYICYQWQCRACCFTICICCWYSRFSRLGYNRKNNIKCTTVTIQLETILTSTASTRKCQANYRPHKKLKLEPPINWKKKTEQGWYPWARNTVMRNWSAYASSQQSIFNDNSIILLGCVISWFPCGTGSHTDIWQLCDNQNLDGCATLLLLPQYTIVISHVFRLVSTTFYKQSNF